VRALVAGVFILLCVGVGQAHPVAAQQIDAGRAAVVSRRSITDSSDLFGGGEVALPDAPFRVSTKIRSVAPLVSAIVPGGGQFILGDNRFLAYAAVEILGWLKYSKDARDQAAQEASFRDLARKVARVGYSTTLPDGNWTYYEAMRDWKSSGPYSEAIDGSVVPAADTTTFNGHQWWLAQRTTPDAASALAQYQRLAYKSDFQWSWENAQLPWDIFKRTTFKRDDAHYSGVQDLIVIGANHFLSMVDAFATLRLSVHIDPAGRTSLGANVRW
jgi:hypothetical protein